MPSSETQGHWSYGGTGVYNPAVDITNVSANYFYDALGRRVAKTIFETNTSLTQSYTYLSDRDKILLAQAGDGSETLLIDGKGIDEHRAEIGPSGFKAYISDHLGSVLNTGAAGAVSSFGAYGERLDSTPFILSPSTPAVIYGFAGRQWDSESGLNYNRVRMYDPGNGRFMSADPLWPISGTNPFTYAQNNPLGLVDPFGLDPCPGPSGSSGPNWVYPSNYFRFVPDDPNNPNGPGTFIHITDPFGNIVPLPTPTSTPTPYGPPLPPGWTPDGPPVYGPPLPPGWTPNGPPTGPVHADPRRMIASKSQSRLLKSMFFLAALLLQTTVDNAYANDVGSGVVTTTSGGDAQRLQEISPELRPTYDRAKRLKIVTSVLALENSVNDNDLGHVAPTFREHTLREMHFDRVTSPGLFSSLGIKSGDTLLAIEGKSMPENALTGQIFNIRRSGTIIVLSVPSRRPNRIELFVKRSDHYLRIQVILKTAPAHDS